MELIKFDCMLLHRLKIALRIMFRQRFFSALNLLGLAVGAASFLLIFAYVLDETTYDQFHVDVDELYRINMTNIWIESNEIFGSTGPAVAQAIRQDIPEIKEVVRIHQPFFGPKLLQVEDGVGNLRHFEETGILAADSTLFEIFSFPLVAGNPTSALQKPQSAVISEDYAAKLFPDENALGKRFQLGVGANASTYMITGIMQNIPDAAHFHFDIMLSMTSFPDVIRRSEAWIWTGFVTYARLHPSANTAHVGDQLRKLPIRYVGEERAAEKDWGLYLQKVTDIRLYSDNVPNRLGPTGSITQVIIFSTVAVLILILSCVNFMNLSTARYVDRAKEVGIQKVLGSPPAHLRMQFLFESTLYASLSVFIGFGLAELSRASFNALSGKELAFNLFEQPLILLVALALIVVIGVVSGSYPAWFLTRFRAIDVLRGPGKMGTGKRMRNTLITFQFTISIALIAVTLIVRNQLTFLHNKDLGFQSEQVLVIPHMEWMDDKGEAFKDRLVSQQIIEDVSLTNAVPPYIWYQENLTPLNSDNVTDLAVSTITADPAFATTLDLELIAGRNFFAHGDGDGRSILVNESCAIQMGWMRPGDDPDVVLGKRLAYYDEDNAYAVVGVLRDFNFWSLDSPIEPLAIFHPKADIWQGDVRFMLLQGNASGMTGWNDQLARVERIWQEFNPQLPFDYRFMDQDFDAVFGQQRRFGQVLNTFSGLAILIAVLGLVGLISFTTEQRTKELSIRKVLGANFPDLIRLITTDFIKLVVISIAIGSAIGWYYADQWIGQFAYQSPISPFAFIIAGTVLTLLILIITTLIVHRNARQNPAHTLRNE